MMQSETSVPGTVQETKRNWREQYREHLAQQPEKVQRTHCWLGRLQAASLGLLVGVFAMALFHSITWRQVEPREIAVWWIVFAACGLPMAIFMGLDMIVLRAMGPVGKEKAFVKGLWAVVMGWLTIAVGLVWSGLMVYLAYGVATWNMHSVATAIESITPVVTVLVLVSIAFGLLQEGVRRLGARR